MILSERERLQKKARTRDATQEERVMSELWGRALVEHDAAPRANHRVGGSQEDSD
jgi:hypothetical protein